MAIKFTDIGFKTKDEFKEDLLWDNERTTIITDEIVDTTRWSEIHDVIFKLDEKFYQTHYSQGLTEYQDESPWEYDDPEIHEVEPKEVTVTTYVRV